LLRGEFQEVIDGGGGPIVFDHTFAEVADRANRPRVVDATAPALCIEGGGLCVDLEAYSKEFEAFAGAWGARPAR
jgi:hypothetical protein